MDVPQEGEVGDEQVSVDFVETTQVLRLSGELVQSDNLKCMKWKVS